MTKYINSNLVSRKKRRHSLVDCRRNSLIKNRSKRKCHSQIDNHDQCSDTDDVDLMKNTDNPEYLTYETAPCVNRLKIIQKLLSLWSSRIPSGGERFFCTLLTIYLLLFLLSVQMFVWILNELQIQARFEFCAPPSITESISTECHIKLLIVAWIASILLSMFQMATYFLYWNAVNMYRDLKDNPEE